MLPKHVRYQTALHPDPVLLNQCTTVAISAKELAFKAGTPYTKKKQPARARCFFFSFFLAVGLFYCLGQFAARLELGNGLGRNLYHFTGTGIFGGSLGTLDS